MKQIAQMVGVSRPVVSAVLNDNIESSIRVSPEKREKILEIARSLKYRPNPAAMQLNGRLEKSIGIIMGCYIIENRAELVRQLSVLLRLQGYQCYFAAVTDPRHELETIRDLTARGVAGIIQTYTLNRIEHGRHQVPTVGVEDVENADVFTDSRRGIYAMTRHLLDHGRRRIGYICMQNWYNPRKHFGYLDAMAEAGIEIRRDWIVELAWNEQIVESLHHLIRRDKISAFICQSDRVAAKLIVWLSNHGYRVPDDVAVTGYDGSELSNLSMVPLTTVATLTREIARKTVEVMMAKIEHHQLTRIKEPVAVEPMIRLSRSCGCRAHVSKGIYWEWVPMVMDGADSFIKEPPAELQEKIELLKIDNVLSTKLKEKR